MAAEKEARILNNNFVGTEHILLGLSTEKSRALEILNSLGCNLDNIMKTVEKGSDVVGVEIAFNSEAKELFQNAWAEAKKFGQPVTELHLLIALTYSEGKHIQIFKDLNIDIDKIKTLSVEKAEKMEIKLNSNGLIVSTCYILIVALLVLFSYILLNNLISSLSITYSKVIFIVGLIITTFFVRNKLIFHFGVGQVPIKLIELIRTICLVIGILFIAILILVSIIWLMITIGKYRYSA